MKLRRPSSIKRQIALALVAREMWPREKRASDGRYDMRLIEERVEKQIHRYPELLKGRTPMEFPTGSRPARRNAAK
jgi:hypothetical protein